MQPSAKITIRKRLILRAIAHGWTQGQELLSKEKLPKSIEEFVFSPGFGQAVWGNEIIVLRDIKTTRGQTISEEAWRFHQHILLDFLQIHQESTAYEYLAQFTENE